MVGVNRFEVEEEKPIPIQRIDPALERKAGGAAAGAAGEARRRVRGRRRWQAVEEAARSGANLMPRIVAAVEAYATVGEISDAMRRVFGEYKEAVVI